MKFARSILILLGLLILSACNTMIDTPQSRVSKNTKHHFRGSILAADNNEIQNAVELGQNATSLYTLNKAFSIDTGILNTTKRHSYIIVKTPFYQIALYSYKQKKSFKKVNQDEIDALSKNKKVSLKLSTKLGDNTNLASLYLTLTLIHDSIEIPSLTVREPTYDLSDLLQSGDYKIKITSTLKSNTTTDIIPVSFR